MTPSVSTQSPLALMMQVLRFTGIGICATLVHVTVALAVGTTLNLSPMSANLAGFAVAFAVSYLGHIKFTFRVATPNASHLRRFLVLSALSLTLSSAITAIATAQGATLTQAMICVGLIVPAVSFIGARFWAFSDGASA